MLHYTKSAKTQSNLKTVLVQNYKKYRTSRGNVENRFSRPCDYLGSRFINWPLQCATGPSEEKISDTNRFRRFVG